MSSLPLSTDTPLLKPPIEPLRFERQLVERVWGGRSLAERFGFEIPAGRAIGETWELVDRADENSVVAEGAFQGRKLRELMEEYGAEILGSAPAGKDGRFPLLVKYIDAKDNLSVQVHPDERAAARLGNGAEPKSEAWYVLDRTPEGALYCGLASGVTRESFAAVANGPGVLEAIQRWDVRRGDCVLVPGGTVHSIGAGVTILEVQQNSDTTYRLWDWGRSGRETHVEQALDSIDFDRSQAEPVGPVGVDWASIGPELERAELARSNDFAMAALRLGGSARFDTEGQFLVYAVLEGRGRLGRATGGIDWKLRSGDVWLVPASQGEHFIEPDGADGVSGRLLLAQIRHPT